MRVRGISRDGSHANRRSEIGQIAKTRKSESAEFFPLGLGSRFRPSAFPRFSFVIGTTKFLSARRVQLAGWALVAGFAWLIAQFYDPQLGFTKLLAIGDQLEVSTTTKLK